MPNVEDFLSAKEEEEVVKAIREAELDTSGEVRVHIEKTSGTPPYERAIEVFHQLKMDNTKLGNGVLIYVAVEDHKFVIYGDRGINTLVPENFWDTTKEVIAGHFRNGNFKQGLVDGILMAGKQLKQHFPWQTDDINELPDEISKGSLNP